MTGGDANDVSADSPTGLSITTIFVYTESSD